jgi:hypothetical protein
MATPRPPAEATSRGHVLEWDPPQAMPAVRRWTCSLCGEAVLESGGVIYGQAAERACPRRFVLVATASGPCTVHRGTCRYARLPAPKGDPIRREDLATTIAVHRPSGACRPERAEA